MPTGKIIYMDDDRLRQQAKQVEKFDSNLHQLAQDMLETMRAHRGFGLAAPQLGVMQRLFVAEIPLPEEDEPQLHPLAGRSFVLVNPEIVGTADTAIEGEEGCLSIPQLRGLVARPTWIEVKAQNLDGQMINLKADDLLARIFLHEIDHLNGILFIDHIRDDAKVWCQSEEEDRQAQSKKAPLGATG